MKIIGIRSMGSPRWLAAVIGVLGIVGGAREVAWANDLNFRGVVRGTDFLSAGVGGLRNIGSGTITLDRKSTRLNSSHSRAARMPSSA